MNDIEAGSAIGVGVVKGALVKVDGEDLGVFDTTSAATNVPTDLEGVGHKRWLRRNRCPW